MRLGAFIVLPFPPPLPDTPSGVTGENEDPVRRGRSGVREDRIEFTI